MMKQIPFSAVRLHDGFWKVKQDMVRGTTAQAVYDRFSDTHRFDALRCQWAEEGKYQAHIFWDSDVAKWIEGVAYILTQTEAPELEKICDDAIEQIVQNADENGYFNSYFLCTEQDQRFRTRSCHELYCAGHLMEAAVAYRDATGKDALLQAMCKYADYIERVFKTENSAAFTTPGHPELELALVKLARATGEKRYLELSKYFIDQHGCNDKDQDVYEDFDTNYNQDLVPLRDIRTAEGHCVRALYLLCGMIDVADAYGDHALADACRRVFDNIVNKRMYITGSVGSTHIGEAFTVDYHLPGRTAYAETCAAISLALFASRMANFEVDSKYADAVERAIYNGVLSGVSMDGRSFFYENPLEIDPKFNHVNTSTRGKERMPITERLEVFGCSCCPPNIVRFIPSIAGMMYGIQEDTLYVHQYMSSQAEFAGVKITQRTAYPTDGAVSITATGVSKIALRIPGWCRSFQLNVPYELKNGYAIVDSHTEVVLELDMPVTAIAANRQVHDCAGRVAVTRGPVVYCIEGVDNGEDLKSVSIDPKGDWKLAEGRFLLPEPVTTGYRPLEAPTLYAPAEDTYEEIPLTFIPYYAFANRGTTEMQVWVLRK